MHTCKYLFNYEFYTILQVSQRGFQRIIFDETSLISRDSSSTSHGRRQPPPFGKQTGRHPTVRCSRWLHTRSCSPQTCDCIDLTDICLRNRRSRRLRGSGIGRGVFRSAEHHVPVRTPDERQNDRQVARGPDVFITRFQPTERVVTVVEGDVQKRITPIGSGDFRRAQLEWSLPKSAVDERQAALRTSATNGSLVDVPIVDVHAHVEIVVPWDHAVVSVGPERCAVADDVRDVDEFRRVDERTNEVLEHEPFVVDHQRSEEVISSRPTVRRLRFREVTVDACIQDGQVDQLSIVVERNWQSTCPCRWLVVVRGFWKI